MLFMTTIHARVMDMFNKGDYVSYRSEGVCKISDIRNENFSGAEGGVAYYILSPVNDTRSTLFVPIDNDRLIAMMRPLLSPEQIVALCAELRDERMPWIEENRARGAAFRDILADGDRGRLIVLVNTVAERIEKQQTEGKRPLGTDLNAVIRAVHLLYEEFSATTDLSSPEEILALLRGERPLVAK